MKRSIRHHYLPVFYIKGFCDSSCKIYIYDKIKNEFRYEYPENIFFINNLNTTTSPSGKKQDWIEGLYSYSDDKSAPLIRKIIKSKISDVPLSVKEKIELSIFITTLFLRVPAQDELVKELRENIGFNQPYFAIKDKLTGERVSEEITAKMLEKDDFQKAYRVILTIIPQLMIDNIEKIAQWNFYYQDPGFSIISDNPILYFRKPKLENILDDFMIPLSCNRTLVSCQRMKKENKEPSKTIEVACALLHQSQRYIGFYRKDYLETIVQHYNDFKRYWDEFDYMEELFR
jgi:hypothetical protein